MERGSVCNMEAKYSLSRAFTVCNSVIFCWHFSMVKPLCMIIFFLQNLRILWYIHFSVVAYSVALGLIMSVGRQVTGTLPTGKVGPQLLDEQVN